MARVSTIVTNFQSGEFSPRLEGRIDLQKYSSGTQELTNMLVFPQGGVTRRPGTYYAGTSKDGGKVRLIPFEFSDEQAYILEFGANYIRFFKDGGILTETVKNITAITKANPAVATSNSHGFSNGDRVFISGVVGMTEVNNREFTVAGATTNTFELSGINSSAFTTYSSGGTAGKIVEVTTTYSVTDIFEINYTQSADVLFLAHKDHEPAKLTRTTATSFTLADIDFIDGPYLDENSTTTTITASANTGTVTLTASADFFVSGHVGALFQFRERVEIGHEAWAASTSYAQNDLVHFNGNLYKKTDSGSDSSGTQPPVHLDGTETYGIIDWQYQHSGTGFVKITAVTNATTATAVVQTHNFLVLPAVATAGTTQWSEGAFSTKNGFPRAVAFYEQRLFFAGTVNQPQTIFASKTADFENMTPGTNDDDAINVTIASDTVNVIKHMIQGRFLQILTSSAEFTLSGGTGSTVATPTNVNVLRETTFGSGDVRPLRAGSATILIQKGAEKVKEVSFNLDNDGLIGRDLTILAEHLTRGGVTDMTWQQEPELVLWFVRSDGVLIGLSYDPANQTIGWHSHTLGGTAVVESIASIPSGAEDQVYLSVKRTINSQTVRHVVFMKSIFFTEVKNAFYVDSGLTYDSTATTTITGLNHLEGETIQVLADGSAHADKTVSGGSITLDRSASVVHIGYSYNSNVETLRLEAGADDGISQGKIKRIHNVTVRFINTVGAKVGPSSTDLDRIPFRDSSMSMDTAVPMFNGDKEVFFPSGYDNDARVYIQQDQPLPMTVLAVMRRSNTFDV